MVSCARSGAPSTRELDHVIHYTVSATLVRTVMLTAFFSDFLKGAGKPTAFFRELLKGEGLPTTFLRISLKGTSIPTTFFRDLMRDTGMPTTGCKHLLKGTRHAVQGIY